METVDWNTLPSLVLHQIFTYLSTKSRVAASSTCKDWRTALYHPLFWHDLALDISPSGSSHANVNSKVEHVNQHLVTLVRNIRLTFDSHSMQCFELAVSVMKALLDNQLLRNIDIKLGHFELSMKSKEFRESSVQKSTQKWSGQSHLEFAIMNIVKKGNIEGFSFGYLTFYFWHALIHLLAKYSCHSLQRLDLAGLGPTVFNGENKILYFNSTFNSMESLINLKKLSLDLNSITCKLLSALCSMPQLNILVLHVHEELDIEISDDIWADLKKHCPKLELRLTIINCHNVVKSLHTKLLQPSMPLTHLKVLFCNMMNIHVLHKLLDYRNTLQSLIWVDEQSVNPTSLLKGHRHLEPSVADNETNPLIILSWVCKKLSELVIFGYFIEPLDVCGIARLRGSKLKRFELLEEDIFFNQSQNVMIYDEVVSDVSVWLVKNWKPLNKNSLFLSHSHYILKCISKDLTTNLHY